jgi:hypothetical protein
MGSQLRALFALNYALLSTMVTARVIWLATTRAVRYV